jgi:inner membrane protein
MVAANLPDIDVLVFATGIPSVSFRRGWTHGVLAQALLPVGLVVALMTLDRWRRRRESPESRNRDRCRPFWLLLLGYVGVYSHVFLDYLNNYGVRLLTPLDWRWFYGDAVFIVDPWLWASLGFGVWLARRTGGARPALVALVFASVYIAGMWTMARSAREFVASAWAAQSGEPARALMVGPVPVVPWTREVIIDAGDHYRTGRFTAWPSRLELAAERVPKNNGGGPVAEARVDPAVTGFLVWARFPFWEVTPSSTGAIATVRDMRFRNRLGGGFAASARVSSSPASQSSARPDAIRLGR